MTPQISQPAVSVATKVKAAGGGTRVWPLGPAFEPLSKDYGIIKSAIQILGHPRGRIYKLPPGAKDRLAACFALAARLDKAVEIDAYPDRQDLSIDLVRLAKKLGCRISLGTDSHDPSQLKIHRTRTRFLPDRGRQTRPNTELPDWR